VSALVLDAAAFIAVERDDRSMIARLRVAQLHGHELRTSAIVIAQVWRSPGGKQARLARLLPAVDVRSVDDPIDATVVLIASSGDRILTSDPADIAHLASCSGKRLAIVAC